MTTSCRPAPAARVAPRRCLALAAAALVALAGPRGVAAGDDPPAGAVPLFDGKSLDGWKPSGGAGAAEVKVEGGALLLPPGNPMTGVACTRPDLPRTDYELTYEAKRTAGGDFFAAATFPVGQSFVTLVNGGWGGTVTGLSRIDGADASENETNRSFKYRDDTWYAFRVRVTDDAIRCWIDDQEVVAFSRRDREVSTRIESRSSQPLGFATWRTGGALRKVAVRPLTPAEVASNRVPEP